jgi:hypothetical protein
MPCFRVRLSYIVRIRIVSDAAAVTREDVLLLLVDGADGRYAMDTVRLMKGAFLVARRGRSQWQGLFNFQAYDYGPFDPRVYDTRDELIHRGLLEPRNGRYEKYTLTAAGRHRAGSLRRARGEEAAWIRRIGRYVSTRSFSQLLEEIYAAFPEFRERSIYRR